MMKIKQIIYFCVALSLAACTADDDTLSLNEEQQSLLGQAVDFSTSMADAFVTRTTYIHDGSFNEGDQMRIFRQYAADAAGTTFEKDTIFRTYYLKKDYATGTSVSLNDDWVPMAGKLKMDSDGKMVEQTAADSLTWENGSVVRFRAWGRSNLAGVLNANTQGSYYPDYTVSDWVTVSGPTKSIPLTMRHITCRIGLTCKAGNEFGSAEICTDWHDYKRQDNADTKTNDDTETAKTDDEAKDELAKVMAVYNKMCMPAGVDDETFLLTAMLTARYDTTTYFKDFEKSTAGIIKISELDSATIRTTVQHPKFNANDGRLYMMSIPFDMSKESAGEELTLPACTRFKVWLYDVNNGDRSTTTGSTGSENNYHIFALSDIMKSDGVTPMFPNGLTLKAGYSYLFSVGYHYDKFTITAADSFKWDEQNLGTKNATDQAQTQSDLDFTWWTSAYVTAAKAALKGGDFLPTFSIANQTQFITFIKLVNGKAAKRMTGLTRGDVRKDDSGNVITDSDGFETYWWKLENGDVITKDSAQKLGYVFYPHFYPTVSTQAAHVIEDYVTGPMDFYDTDFGNCYEVNLTADLDLYDWALPSIGEDSSKPFRGNFKGNGHKLSNLYLTNKYLFDNVMDGAITNLRIESTHDTCLLNIATSSNTKTGWGCYIAGISLLCNSTNCAIANSLSGNSYVVGCIHVGNASGALVGSADKLTMLGCMQAASGITSGTGALVGNDNVKLNDFIYCYYDTEKSSGTNAVGTKTDDYDYDDYIRGSKSHVLKAKNDYLIGDDVDKTKLSANMKNEMYGLAPWKAMNLGIDKYNDTAIGKKYPCSMVYQSSTVGYTHLYPTLVSQ